MVLSLQKMTEKEFDSYIKHSMEEYKRSNIENGRWDQEEATEVALNQYKNLLPDGLQTKGHYIFSVLNNDAIVGTVWIQLRETKGIKKAFIVDIEILNEYRGKGFGKKSLQIIEDWLKSIEVKTLNLHVLESNTVARHLYFDFGFKDLSHNMSKDLE